MNPMGGKKRILRFSLTESFLEGSPLGPRGLSEHDVNLFFGLGRHNL